MPIISLIVVLIVIGVLLWVVNTYLPMDPQIRSIINVIVLIAILLWLLSVFGLLGPIRDVRVGRL
jgi:hypothetical protein